MSTPQRLVQTAPVPAWTTRAYADLHERAVNFAPISWAQAVADPAWQTDRRQAELPSEQPGPPQGAGPFEVARGLLIRYEVADPALVRAVYDAREPLEGRNMLLVGRFFGLRFPMGVRVGGVVDEAGELNGARVHRFAWHYRTLEGHLERGQMDYEVVKYLDDGRVQFRIAAYSQRGTTPNPIVRAGLAVFGRSTQLRFYTRALQRMQTLTAAGIGKVGH